MRIRDKTWNPIWKSQLPCCPLEQNRKYPVCETEWVKLISLPCHNDMLEEDIDYVIYWVNKYFDERV